MTEPFDLGPYEIKESRQFEGEFTLPHSWRTPQTSIDLKVCTAQDYYSGVFDALSTLNRIDVLDIWPRSNDESPSWVSFVRILQREVEDDDPDPPIDPPVSAESLPEMTNEEKYFSTWN